MQLLFIRITTEEDESQLGVGLRDNANQVYVSATPPPKKAEKGGCFHTLVGLRYAQRYDDVM